VPLYKIAQHVGHSSIDTTLGYVRDRGIGM
jgi:hypothetical protein